MMKVTCRGCHKTYNIPDKRLQFGREIAFPCPTCDGLIELDLRDHSTETNASTPQTEKEPQTPSSNLPNEGTIKVTCSGCHRVYDIPEKRLQFEKDITFPCPACNDLIEIDLHSHKIENGKKQKTPQKEEVAAGSPPSNLEKPDDLPSGDRLKAKILRAFQSFPPMPQIVSQAQKVINDPTAGIKEISDILEADQAIVARILKIANSTFYGRSGKVGSIEDASVLLGHKTLVETIAALGTSQLLGKTLPGYGLEAGALWRHSLAVAHCSEMIAKRKNPGLSDDAFIAGLIHDVGKLILDKHIQQRKVQFGRLIHEDQQSVHKAEKQVLGFDHAEIAADICVKWNIPKSMTVAVKNHHYPSRSRGNEMGYFINAADMIASGSGFGTGPDGEDHEIESKTRELLSLSDDYLAQIQGQMMESVEKISEAVMTN
ncbi:HDOD domain-containing protein [Thermodesulfobacteriota bacterium]